MDQQLPANEEKPAPRRRKGSRAWKLARRTFLLLLFLPAAFFLLFQWQPVQDWMAKQVTSSISKTLETRVAVEKVRLSWLDELTIEGLFIEDKYGDTLLYGKTLEAEFTLFPWLQIEHILIADTRFQIRRNLGDPESNLTTALNKLFPPKEKANNPLDLDLERVDLQRIRFVQNDSVKGQRFDISLASGIIRLDNLNLPDNEVRIAEAELREPLVKQTSIPPSPIDPALLRLDSIIKQAADTNSLRITANSIEVIDGGYALDNLRKDPIASSDITAVDFGRLGISNIDLELIDTEFYNGDFIGALKHLSLEEKSGFVLDRLSVQDLKISPTELQLYDLELVTAESSLSDSLRFTFRNGWGSWSDFNNEVRMDIRVKESEVAVRDILYFARKLRFNRFFRDNIRQKVTIGGHFRRNVNNLRADDIYLALDNTTSMRGSFGSRNLAKPGSEALDFNLDRLSTNMATLRKLIPSFRPPENFDRLGGLIFSGDFEGTFSDYIYTKGSLRTDIGRADLNLTLLFPERRLPTYTGQLGLDEFDLGAWTGDPNFGTVTFSGAIDNGIGLDAAVASADLAATIQDLTYRNYTYRNAIIDGRLEEKFFNGKFEIADDNIDFNFLGELDFRDSIPTFDFDAVVGELDLQALNLSSKPIALSGEIDLNLIGTNFSEMEGRVELADFAVLIDTVTVAIDSLLAFSNFNTAGEKVVKLESDLANGEIIGTFDLDDVTGSVTNYLRTFYPLWADRLNIKAARRAPPPNHFSFAFNIADSRGLNRLLSPQLGPLVDISLSGEYDGFKDLLKAELLAPN
ncbi:MAG: hypothetical protein AAGF89_11675, partial [Bacteroidota bacterium]